MDLCVYIILIQECQILLQNGCLVYVYTSSVPPQILGINQLPNFCQMSRGAGIAFVLTCPSLIVNKLEHPSYAWWLLSFFFGKLLDHNNPWPVFFSGVLAFFLMICRSSLCILDTNPLLVPDIEDIFWIHHLSVHFVHAISCLKVRLFFSLFRAASHQHSSLSVIMLIPFVHFMYAGVAELGWVSSTSNLFLWPLSLYWVLLRMTLSLRA